MTTTDFRQQGISLARVTARLRGVHAGVSEALAGRLTAVSIDDAAGSVLIRFRDLGQLLTTTLNGVLPVGTAGAVTVRSVGGRLAVGGRAKVQGQDVPVEMDCDVSVRGSTIRVIPRLARLPIVGDLTLSSADQDRLVVTIPADQLPFGIQLRTIAVLSDGLRVDGDSVVFAAIPLPLNRVGWRLSRRSSPPASRQGGNLRLTEPSSWCERDSDRRRGIGEWRVTLVDRAVSGWDATVVVAEPEPTAAQALAVLHARHYVSLVRLAVALVDSEASAEEVVQDAFVHVLRRWRSIRDLESAHTYLRRSVVNGARDRLRHRRVRRATALPHAVADGSAEERALLNDEQRQVLRGLADLPARQREVLVLRYFGELTEAATAETLGISIGSVKSTAHKGIAALRRSLADEESV